MKICFVTDYLPTHHKIWGGAEVAALRLARLLISHKYQISFLTLKPTKEPEENLMVYSLPISEEKHFFATNFIKLYLGLDSLSGISSYGILKKLKPDIIHFHRFNSLSLSLIVSAKLLSIPVVFSMYDYGSVCPKTTLINHENRICNKLLGLNCTRCYPSKYHSNKELRLWLKKNIFRLKKNIFRYLLSKIDAFVVLSEYHKAVFQKFGIHRRIIKLSLPLFDENNIANNIPREQSILYTGWLTYHKGLHILIKAMPEIIREVHGVRLYVVETGVEDEYKNQIISLITRYKLEDYVILLGKKRDQEMRSLLQGADAIVVPEQWPNPYPIIITEAMYYARPIVASRIGGIPELISDGKNGLLAEANNPSDFAKKIIQILTNKDFALNLGSNAKVDITRICDEKIILSAILKLYRDISN